MDKISDKALERLWSLAAEAAVLGSMLIDPDCIPKARGIITADDFYIPAHQFIFEAMESLHDDNKPIDAVLLRDELVKCEHLEDIGGVEYIAKILDSVPSSANVAYYAGVVKDRRRYRDLVESINAMNKILQEPDLNVGEQAQQIQQIAFGIEQERAGDGCYDVKDYATAVAGAMQDKQERISSGFNEIDRLIGGFTPGELIIVAGRPSMGKSALALDFALNAAHAGRKVIFFTLEMAYQALIKRAICSLGRVNMQDVKAEPSQETLNKLQEAALELEGLPLILNERGTTPEKQIALIKSQNKARDVDLVVVDYIQLMNSGRKAESRQQEITTISRKLKLAAVAENVPVIALSQLNREVESRTSHRPKMSDLRESGALEQDADVVMLIHREDYYRRNEQPDMKDRDGSTEVIIAKQRNGPTGIAQLVFLDEYICFGDAKIRV